MRPLVLTSADNPRVKSVVKLRDHSTRRKTGLFIAEGLREIQRAAQAGLKLVEIYDCPSLTHQAAQQTGHQSVPQLWPAWEVIFPDAAMRESAQWYEVSDVLLRKMAYKDRPEGAIGIFEQPRWSWDDVTAAANKEPATPPLYLVAVGMAKPGNLGAMARSAAAAGVTAMLVADGVVDAFNPNAVRASTGAVFSLPILGDTSSNIRAWLKEQHIPFYAASPDASDNYTQVDLKAPAALVIGAEDTGLDDVWLTRGTPITIPMNTQKVDSLNASIAAGVLLFEAVRQRLG